MAGRLGHTRDLCPERAVQHIPRPLRIAEKERGIDQPDCLHTVRGNGAGHQDEVQRAVGAILQQTQLIASITAGFDIQVERLRQDGMGVDRTGKSLGRQVVMRALWVIVRDS